MKKFTDYSKKQQVISLIVITTLVITGCLFYDSFLMIRRFIYETAMIIALILLSWLIINKVRKSEVDFKLIFQIGFLAIILTYFSPINEELKAIIAGVTVVLVISLNFILKKLGVIDY